MKVCQFVVPGEPVGKGRPRFDTRGKYARAYTPKKTRDYENLVRMCWKLQSGESFPEGTALRMEIRAYFPIPKSLSAKKQAELDGKPYKSKGDIDNIAKIICDSGNKIIYYDDAQISEMAISKRYSKNPRVEVTIQPCEEK